MYVYIYFSLHYTLKLLCDPHTVNLLNLTLNKLASSGG